MNTDTFHLVYLIEVAIILNFALRELNIKDLINSTRAAQNEANKIIKLNNSVYCKDRYDKLMTLIQGKRSFKDSDGSPVTVWDNGILCCLYFWIISGIANKISAFSIVLNIAILFWITFNHDNADWVFYIFSAIIGLTIFHALVLIFSTNSIASYLLGKDNQDGKVAQSYKDLERCVKENTKIEDKQYITT